MSIPPITRTQALLIVAAMGLLIPLERLSPLWGQLFAGLLVWGMLFRLLSDLDQRQRMPLWLCLVYATAGEIVLSLLWGLYDYRLGNIPPYVPPGHVLLFLLGIYLTPRIGPHLVRLVPLIGLPYFLVAAFSGFDEIGIVLFGLYLACLALGQERALYSTMFVIALLLELWGTAWGSWRWVAEIPGLGLASTNPPLASGAFYSTLDLLIMLSLAPLYRWLDNRENRLAEAIS